MTKTKRKLIRIPNPEQFKRNVEALTRFERQMVDLGGFKGVLTETKALGIMVNTCGSLWGVGKDLYVCSQQRAFDTVTHLVITQVDECISEAVRALADWLELKITYERRGRNFLFRFEKASGQFKELQIPIRQREAQNQSAVN